MLPKSYILTRSGLFQEFAAVSRTNVLSKSLYCAAGSLLGSDDRSLDGEGNFLCGEGIWERLGFKRQLGRCCSVCSGAVWTGEQLGCVCSPAERNLLLKTNGITFQRSPCQVLESRPTFDNFTQFTPADSSTGQGGVWKDSLHCQVSSPCLSPVPS